MKITGIMEAPSTSVARFNALLGFLKQETDVAIALSKDVQFVNVPGGSTGGNRYEATPMFDTVLHMDESKARQLQEHMLQLEAMERICKQTRVELEKTIWHPQAGQSKNAFKGKDIRGPAKIEMDAMMGMEEYILNLAMKAGNGMRIKSKAYEDIKASQTRNKKRHAQELGLSVHLEHLGMDEKNMWCQHHTALDGFYPKNNCQACYCVQQWWTQVKQQHAEGDADMLRALNTTI